MSLRSIIETLREETVAGLGAAHDHFMYSKKLWRIVGADVRRRGRRIILNNNVTGSRVTERELVPIAEASVNEYLPSATIQQFASLTEIFLIDFVRHWLSAYPMHLKGQVDAQTIVAAPDKIAILRILIEQYVLSMSYKRPTEWFKQLNGIIGLGCPSVSEIDAFSEFKATRDVFVHNRGTATEIYLEKSGALARAAVGSPLDLPDSYLHQSWRLCRKIVEDIGTAASARA